MKKRHFLLALIITCSFGIKSFAAADVTLVPQVITPYADFLIPQEGGAHIWTDRPEHGWTVMKRKNNSRGYQTFGAVQWLDGKTHHIMNRSLLPVWSFRKAFAGASVKAAVSHEGYIIASQRDDDDSSQYGPELYWTDSRTGELRRQFSGISYPFVFSPNGKYFAATVENPKTDKYALKILSVPAGNTIKEIDITSYPGNILWSNDSQTLVCINGNTLRMWSTGGFDQIYRAKWEGGIETAFFDSDNMLQVLSHRGDSTNTELRTWKADGKFYTFRQLDTSPYGCFVEGYLPNDSLLLRSLAHNGPNQQFVYYLIDKKAQPVQLTEKDLANPEIVAIIEAFKNVPPPPLEEGDFARLYSTETIRVTSRNVFAADGSHVFDVLSGQLLNAYKPVPPGATAFDISPNGKFFTSAGPSEVATFSKAIWGLWDIKNAQPRWSEQFTSHSPGIDWHQYAIHGRTWTGQLSFSPNSKNLALSGNLGHPALAVYRAKNGEGIWAHPSDAPETLVRHFDWSPDGNKLAVVMEKSSPQEAGTWEIVDARTGRILQKHTVNGKVLFIAWANSDDVLLARQTPDKYDKTYNDQPPRNICYLELRNAKTGTLIRTNSQTFSAINLMAVSPNRHQVAVGYDDASLRVWNIETGKLELDKTAQVAAIDWRGNNQIVTTEINDGVKFCNIPKQKLLATALFMYPWTKAWSDQKTTMDDAQWIIYTPDNYYDCSPDAEKYIRWRVGKNLLPVSAYKSTFHNRQKVLDVINADL
jgi:WD40 repeat protein